MQAIGLNAVDRRRLANLTLKPGTSVLKNFLVLQHATGPHSISLAGIRMLAVDHHCTEYRDILALNFRAAQSFVDPSDRAKIGSLILTAGATERLTAAGQLVLERAGHTSADVVTALDATALLALPGLQPPDASLLFTRGQTAKLSRRGLEDLAKHGKLTLEDTHPLRAADARDLGLITEDCYEIEALRAYDGSLPAAWKLPPPAGAAAWMPRGGTAGGGSRFLANADPDLLDEMTRRGFLPADQAKLVKEGITTVDKLAELRPAAFGYLKIDVSAAVKRAAASQQVTAQQRHELRALLALAPPDGLTWETAEALVSFVGSIDQLCELQLHHHLDHARSLGVSVSEAQVLHRLLFAPTVGLRVAWQRTTAQHLHQHLGLSKAGAGRLGCGCEGVIAAMEIVANDAMVAPLGLSAADVAAAKSVRLMFTKCGQGLAAGSETVSGQGKNGGYQPAVCDCAPMRDGVHYAEFTINGPNSFGYVGVVDGRFDPSASTAQNSRPACNDQSGATWMLNFSSGHLCHGGPSPMAAIRRIEQNLDDFGVCHPPGCFNNGQGEPVGLLLDLNQGSMTVYVNGRRIGEAVPSGSLVGPLYWAADINCHTDSRSHSAVTITRKSPP